MRDLVLSLADGGAASVETLWLPVAAWTAVALAVEAALRLGRPAAALALPVRGAVLAALPASLAVPAALRALSPQAAATVGAFVPDVIWLPEVATAPAPALAPVGPPLFDVALGAAVAGAALLGAVHLVRLAWGLAQAHTLRSRLAPSDADARLAVDDACQRLGVERPVAAVEAPAGAAPFTVGWRRPLVALPPDLSADARDVAALHEVAHVSRADFAWHAAERAVTSAFAWHPLVWVLGRGLALDRERAADALVLSARPESRRAYADLLFSYATLPAPALALGASRGSSSLKHRITAMSRPLSPVRARRLGHLGRLGGLLAALAVVAGTAAMTPTVVPAAPDAAAADTMMVEAFDFRRADDGSSVLTVDMKPGASRADAQAVAEEVDAGADGDRSTRLVVRYDGGTLERDVRLKDGRTMIGGIGAVSFGSADGDRESRIVVEASEHVETLDVTRAGATGLDAVTVRLKPSATRADAERVAVQFADDPGVVSVRAVMADGTVVERAGAGLQARARREMDRAIDLGRQFDGADTTEVYNIVDEMPELIGGLQGLQDRVVYPPDARAESVEGQVVVQFIVDETGAVEAPRVLRSPDDRLSEAALAAVNGSRFTPGREDGRAVKTRFAVPIRFRLPGSTARNETEARAERFPNARLRVSGVDPALFGDTSLFERMTASTGQILRESHPDLADGAQATIRFRVDGEGRIVMDEIETVSSSTPLGNLSRGLVGLLSARPHPDLAGRSFEMVMTYVRGDDRGGLRTAPDLEDRAALRQGYRLDGSSRARPAAPRRVVDRTGYDLTGRRIAD